MDKTLVEMKKALDEIIEMHQINLELLEQIDVVCKWILENKIEIPNREIMVSLLNRADTLLNEIYSSEDMGIRRNFTGTKSDKDLTEPENGFW